MQYIATRLLTVTITALLFGISTSPAMATQADLDREVDALIAELAAEKSDIKLIARQIKWSGISDTRLFDNVASDLLENYKSRNGTDGLEYSSWQVQVLAFSGQEKYLSTIVTVLRGTNRGKLKRHAESALRVLPDFARWNPVIAAGVSDVPSVDIPRQRVMNMLRADSPQLVHAGASIAYNSYLQDAAIIEIVRAQLQSRYTNIGSDAELADAVAWLCKVLGQSGDPIHIPLLLEVEEHSQGSVKRWASAAIDQLTS